MSVEWRAVQDPQLGTVYTPDTQVGPILCRPSTANELSQLVARLNRAERDWQLVYRDTEIDAGDLLVCVSELDEIGPIDRQSQVVVAQTAATWGAVEQVLNEERLTLGPLPGVLWNRPIGLSLSTHDMLRPSPAYGHLTDCLLAIETVLPDGRPTRSSVTPRRATGPDLARCVVGAMGAIGTAIEVRIQAWPLPVERCFRAAEFSSWSAAHTFCRQVLLAGARPAWWQLAREGRVTRLLARFDSAEWAAYFDSLVGEAAVAPALSEAVEAQSFGAAASQMPMHRLATASRAQVGRVAGRHKGSIAWEVRRDGVAFYGPKPSKAKVDPGWNALFETFAKAITEVQA